MRLPGLDGISIADADGDLRYSSRRDALTTHQHCRPPIFPRASRQSEFELGNFQTRTGPDRQKVDGVFRPPTYAFRRRVRGRSQFALQVDKLVKMFATLNVGPRGAVGLWSEDATLIARFPRVEELDEDPSALVKPSPEFAQLVANGRDSGFFHTHSPLDGETRLFAMRKVGRFPLFLIVGLADVDYFAEWRTVAGHLVIVSGLFLIASIVGGLLIYSRSATKAKAEAQSRLAASVYENSSEGMAIIDAARSIVDVNHSFTKLTDSPPRKRAVRRSTAGFRCDATSDSSLSWRDRYARRAIGPASFG